MEQLAREPTSPGRALACHWSPALTAPVRGFCGRSRLREVPLASSAEMVERWKSRMTNAEKYLQMRIETVRAALHSSILSK